MIVSIEALTDPAFKALFSKRLESLAEASKQSLEEPIKHMLAPMSFEEALAFHADGPVTKHHPLPNIRKIIAGGQTGADRAARDWAMERGIEHGGWCPKDGTAEDGVIPARYNLTETEVTEYSMRTRRNVQESDGTVIITLGRELTGGSRETADFARQIDKKHFHLWGAVRPDAGAALRGFVRMYGLEVLNVAGSRES
jgi:hypothetical protein